MARETLYIVQPYRRNADGKLVPEVPVPAKDASEARNRALRMKSTKTGVVAFSRTGDADTGEYDDPIIITKFGDLPEELDGQ